MKAEKIFSRRKGFSLIELFVAMIIIALFTSFITTNITSQSQTAKAEAEKLAAYITGLARKADRRHLGFTITFNSNSTTTSWDRAPSPDIFALAPGFSLEKAKNFTYNSNKNEFEDYDTITLKRDLDGKKCYIVIGDVGGGGRIRVSEDNS